MKTDPASPESLAPESTSPAPIRFPYLISDGDVRAMIYRTPVRIRGVRYDSFTLAWHLNGRRRRQRFHEFKEAEKQGQKIVLEKSQGTLAVAAMTATDRVALESAMADLARAEGTGFARISRLIEIVRDYTAACVKLPKGATLAEAVEYFADRHPANRPRKSVPEVVGEFIADRENAGCSEIHLRDLGIRLKNQFADAFRIPIGSLSAPVVKTYVYGLKRYGKGAASSRSKENMLRAIVSLCNFARRSKYITADLALEIADIQAPKKEHSTIEIFCPEEMEKLLHQADPDLVPALAIGAFAGLRLSEIARLEWEDLKWRDRLIVVGAEKSKTAARRLVPISSNLAAWLAPQRKRSGPISPASESTGGNVGNSLAMRFTRVARKAGVKWKRNGARHSYISYRVATLKDVPAVALECGNSPAMIFSNYRALATAKEGQEWFSIRPPKRSAKIIPIPERRSRPSTALAATRPAVVTASKEADRPCSEAYSL